MKNCIAVVGASGAVGRKMLDELASRAPAEISVRAFASARSVGMRLPFREGSIVVEEFAPEKIKDAFVLMSAGGDFSRKYSSLLVDRDCLVIDNSSAWRMDESIPLVVPEVNSGALSKSVNRGIIANPNCSTIQMVVSLKPLLDKFGIQSVHVATYQSVSGAGQKGIDDLTAQLKDKNASANCLPRKIAHDVIPAIDRILAEGHCFEEVKMVQETRKILGKSDLKVLATTVRVPTFYGHGEAITVELGTRLDDLEQVYKVFLNAPGLKVSRAESYDDLPTPLSIGETPLVHLSRLRFPVGEQSSNVVQFWNVAHNLYKGAASNAVQILMTLLRETYE